MRWANIFRLGVKELRGLARDPVMVVLVIYAFTLQVYAEATAFSDVPHNAAVAVVDEDRSQLSERIIDDFYPPQFTVPPVVTTADMDRRLDRGADTFVLDIPMHFERDVLAGRSPAIQLNVDANQMTEAFAGTSAVENVVAGAVADSLQRHRASPRPPVDIDLRTRYNPNLIYRWFLSVTSIMDSITLMTIVLAGAALIREREHGTVEHLLVMPVQPVEIMLSKIWAMGLVVLVASVFSLSVVVRGIMAVPVHGSVWLFTLGAALEILASAGMGIALATIADSMPQFGLLAILVILPLLVLSGSLSPRESMPWLARTLMLGAPNTHFVILAQSVLFRGAGLGVVWPQLLALVGISAALFAFALTRFRRFLQ